MTRRAAGLGIGLAGGVAARAASGSTVTYRGMAPGVSLSCRVTAAGLTGE